MRFKSARSLAVALVVIVLAFSSLATSMASDAHRYLVDEIQAYLDYINQFCVDENTVISIDTENIPAGTTFDDLKKQVDDLAFGLDETDAVEMPRLNPETLTDSEIAILSDVQSYIDAINRQYNLRILIPDAAVVEQHDATRAKMAATVFAQGLLVSQLLDNTSGSVHPGAGESTGSSTSLSSSN